MKLCSRGSSVSAQTTVLFICYESEDFLFVRFVFGDPSQRGEKIRGQMVRHTVVYGQIDKIFCSVEGFDVSMTLKKFFSPVNNDESFAYLNDEIFTFRIHLISQAEWPSILMGSCRKHIFCVSPSCYPLHLL